MLVKGYFRILNFFDIGEAFELEKLRALLGTGAIAYPPAFIQRSPEYAQAQNVPLQEKLQDVKLATGETLEANIKYYWFGVASLEFTTPFQCQFEAFSCESSRWMNAPEVENAAEDLLRKRLQQIQPAVMRPAAKWLDEDYLVIDIQSARYSDQRSATAAEMIERNADEIAQVVRGEIVRLVESVQHGPRDLRRAEGAGLAALACAAV